MLEPELKSEQFQKLEADPTFINKLKFTNMLLWANIRGYLQDIKLSFQIIWLYMTIIEQTILSSRLVTALVCSALMAILVAICRKLC